MRKYQYLTLTNFWSNWIWIRSIHRWLCDSEDPQWWKTPCLDRKGIWGLFTENRILEEGQSPLGNCFSCKGTVRDFGEWSSPLEDRICLFRKHCFQLWCSPPLRLQLHISSFVLSLPPKCIGKELDIGAFGGVLCVLLNHDGGYFEMWTKEDGQKQNWIKLIDEYSKVDECSSFWRIALTVPLLGASLFYEKWSKSLWR